MSIVINKIGTLVTIQDGGRIGYQSQGVPVGGAMDDDAFALANMLVGNACNAACLEIASGNLELVVTESCVVTLTGGGILVQCYRNSIPFNRRIEIRAGATLKFSQTASGYWTYLSIAGGINVEPVLGSRSTYLPANFGGLKGRPLKKGDKLEILAQHQVQLAQNQLIAVPSWGAMISISNNPIRVFRGPDWDRMTDKSQRCLLEKGFKISADSNRMGYRLSGQSIIMHDNTELISTPVTRGTIQVTNDGTPIVLMADAQTIGGYPRIAQVAEVDLPRLAQVRSGESVRFQLISYDDACALFLSREQERKKLEIAIALQLKM